jgi:hypothetical protein
MDNTRSFDLAGIRCVFAQGPERPCSDSAKAPLIASAHHLSDALQAEHVEITHFQEAAKRLDDQMHELQRACEAYLTTCHTIDTGSLSLEMEHLSATGSCPYAKRD